MAHDRKVQNKGISVSVSCKHLRGPNRSNVTRESSFHQGRSRFYVSGVVFLSRSTNVALWPMIRERGLQELKKTLPHTSKPRGTSNSRLVDLSGPYRTLSEPCPGKSGLYYPRQAGLLILPTRHTRDAPSRQNSSPWPYRNCRTIALKAPSLALITCCPCFSRRSRTVLAPGPIARRWLAASWPTIFMCDHGVIRL